MTLLALTLLAASSKAKTTTSGSYEFLFVILLIALAGYFLFLRPQQQRAKKAREQQSTYEVGDEVLTVGGIVGRIVDITDDRVTIISGETEDGATLGEQPTRLVMVRRAIAQRITPPVPDDGWASGEGEDDASGEHDDEDARTEDDEHVDGEGTEHDEPTEGENKK